MISRWISTIVEEKLSSIRKTVKEVNENMMIVTKNAYILSTLVKENRETLNVLMHAYASLLGEMSGKLVEPKGKNLLELPRDTADDDLPN
tara:strand:- start:712 stop:981 length:270 start_codon:yes stop_codon:yes gene_type:complete